MPTLELKPTHKVVTAYYDNLAKFAKLGIKHETAVRSAFQELLERCASQFDWKLVPEWVIDQYRVTKNDHGNIVSDPNRMDDEQYIVRIIGQVITMSLETMKVVKGLPPVVLELNNTRNNSPDRIKPA
jgi:hypothetical protein